MADYKSKYEAYKNTLLGETWFRRELNDLYRGSIRVEKDYIDENGVLWKVGLLGAVCGFCIAFLPIENGNWALGIALFICIMGSLSLARHIGSRFKKKSGERKFYAFWYDKYFEDRVNEDRRREMYQFEQEISKVVGFMQYCIDKPDNDHSEVIEDFRRALHYVEELEKRYKEVLEYDSFPGWLKNDYQFNAEMQKDLDK